MCQLIWKVDQSENVSSWSQFKHCSKSLVQPIWSHMWSLYVPILWKVDQKRNWVKLKSVWTLLKIACSADRKSYHDMWSLFVPVHVKSWPKVKLGQVEVDSDIAQNHFHSSQEVISAHYLHKFIWQHTWFSRYSPLNTQIPRFDI